MSELSNESTKETKNKQLSSKNESWQQNLEKLLISAATDHPILLLGASGVGKDVLAQEVHRLSSRKHFNLQCVNCSALSENLIESELFGHIKGSFTGATSDRKGAFESARHGTLFLDEIGDLSFSLQAKLLRAIENKEIRPVGSDKTIKTNVRLIAATHQNLFRKIKEGSFRSDLFYRLSVLTFEVPNLKERIEDFDDLIYEFSRNMKVRFSFDAILELKKYSWPGNIRELKNFVSRASAIFPEEKITVKHLPQLLQPIKQFEESAQFINYNTQNLSLVKEFEKQIIMKRLSANAGNKKRTAYDLGMPKSTLYDRIKSYEIDIENFKTKTDAKA